MEGYPRKVFKCRRVLSRKRPKCDTDACRTGTDLILVKEYLVKSPSLQSSENISLLGLAKKK